MNSSVIKVLILHSFHHGDVWTDSVQDGIEDAFAEGAEFCELDVEYMDLMNHNEAEVVARFIDLCFAKYDENQPDLVITAGIGAMEFFLETQGELFPGVPAVFSGFYANEYDPGMLLGTTDYIGVIERLDLASTISLMIEIHPNMEQIAVIHDRTEAGLDQRERIESLQPLYADKVDFIFPDTGRGLTEEEIVSWVEAVDKSTGIYFLGFREGRNGRLFPVDYIINRISEVASVPVYSYLEQHLGHGIVGGKVLRGLDHGYEAGRIAVDLVLRNAPVVSGPRIVSSNRYMFDHQQLQRFGISQDSLPEDRIIVNGPRTFLEKYWQELLIAGFGVVILLILTIVLLFNFFLRRRAEKELEESEATLQALIHSSSDIIVLKDMHFRFILVNPAMCELVGMRKEELIGKTDFDVFPKEQAEFFRETDKEVLRSGRPKQVDEHVLGIEGNRWVNTAKSPVSLGKDRCKGVLVVVRDINRRKEAEDKLKKTLHEKDLLMKEMNHRVKNNLALVSSFISLKAGELGEKAEFSDLVHRIEAIRIVHEKLYKSEKNNEISMAEYLQEIMESVFMNTADRPVKIVNSIERIILNPKTAIPVGLIVNELATNAVKHGFSEEEEPIFTVSLKSIADGSGYTLTVSNTGNPFPAEELIRAPKTMGFQIITALLTQIHGKLDLVCGKETTFRITFDYQKSS
ncbi:MAG: PAS domain S-box protein [Spirochaetia bacterium]